MKIKTLLLVLIFAASTCFAQNKSINFEAGSFAEIKAKAKKENKLIFIDAFTTWCGPCKWLAKNVFTNDTVAEYFNTKFINASIDMEKGEGIEIAKQYEVRCYPNLLFIDGDGNIVHRSAGALNVKKFIQFAENAQNPEKKFSKYKNEYESKKNDTKFLYEYIYIISTTCLPYKDIVIDYFKTQKDEELAGRANWNVIRDFTKDYESREFQYLLSNVETFNKTYTTDSVNTKIKNVLISSGNNIIYKKDMKDDDYKSYKKEISKLNYTNIDEVLFRLDMAYLERKEDWKKYFDLAIEKGDKYFKNMNEFNNISWSIYEHSDDVKTLQKASSWMQKTLEIKENQIWYMYDTYASVLFKLKNKAEAKAAATKAIELAKATGTSEDEYKTTIELLEKIEKLK
ncbi:MAG: hypothetical protein A2X08_04195 [Bacteroidetes bacterium GWA2_32_17]|nr:MAG: hypothetical protein A2X08_04195 [Bacteroidetes bacterium GWA2_32_17]